LFTSTNLLRTLDSVNSKEFMKWLAARGCTFESHRGGSGHQTVILGDKRSVLPVHGSRKELGKGLMEKVKKDLGLK
jgi:mRNA interferase HicA